MDAAVLGVISWKSPAGKVIGGSRYNSLLCSLQWEAEYIVWVKLYKLCRV